MVQRRRSGIPHPARSGCIALGAERTIARLRQLVFETLLRQDVQFFDRRDTGEITTRLWADVPALSIVLGEDLADAMRFTVFCLGGTALLVDRLERLRSWFVQWLIESPVTIVPTTN